MSQENVESVRKPLRVRRTRKVIEVSFEVREAHIAE